MSIFCVIIFGHHIPCPSYSVISHLKGILIYFFCIPIFLPPRFFYPTFFNQTFFYPIFFSHSLSSFFAACICNEFGYSIKRGKYVTERLCRFNKRRGKGTTRRANSSGTSSTVRIFSHGQTGARFHKNIPQPRD